MSGSLEFMLPSSVPSTANFFTLFVSVNVEVPHRAIL
jgi:hypothetical protein